MSDPELRDFMVRQDDLHQVRFSEPAVHPEQALEAGDALLRIDRYAFTANNITYALMGKAMNYWNFFPAPEGWGRIPVWGYADVVASRAENLPEGARVFGYLPMSPWLRVCAERVTPDVFFDGSAHRRALPGAYQRYLRVPRSDATSEDIQAVLRPLANTGLLIADWLVEQAQFGAQQVVLASASSKTALGAAFHLSRHAPRDFSVIGLTATRNRAFCERTGYYDRVLEYAELESLPANVPAVYVDMAGNRAVLRRVHTHFATGLRYSCLVGLSHGDPAAIASPGGPLPGPAPQLFFAPSHIETRQKALGPVAFAKHIADADAAFLASARSWIEIVRGRGMAAIEATYRAVLEGRAAANQGHMLSL
jgi:hypothetical protein